MTGKTKEKRAKDRAWKKLVKESQKNYWRGVIERTQKELDEYGLGGYASTRKRIDITLTGVLTSVYGILDKTLTRKSRECKLAKDEVYPFLEGLFRLKDFRVFDCEKNGGPFCETCDEPQLYDSPLYYVAMQGDQKMLEFLLNYVNRDAPYHHGLYDAVLEHYLYMKLPDWGDLAKVSGSQEKLLTAVEMQADALGVKHSPVLRALFEAGFPSKYRKLPLKSSTFYLKFYPDLDADPERGRGYHVIVDGVDWTVMGNGDIGFYHNDGDMVRALTGNGEFYPFTCECGYAECADLHAPIQCLKTPAGMRWYKPFPRPMSCIVFNPKPVLVELERALSAVEKELNKEWFSPDKKYNDLDFPYGPNITAYVFKRNLAFCRRRLNRIQAKTSGKKSFFNITKLFFESILKCFPHSFAWIEPFSPYALFGQKRQAFEREFFLSHSFFLKNDVMNDLSP